MAGVNYVNSPWAKRVLIRLLFIKMGHRRKRFEKVDTMQMLITFSGNCQVWCQVEGDIVPVATCWWRVLVERREGKRQY